MDISAPRLSAREILIQAISDLKPSECLEVFTRNSVGYAASQEGAAHGSPELIGRFSFHLGVHEAPIFTPVRPDQSPPDPLEQVRLQSPADLRCPRTPLPEEKLSQLSDALLRGSDSLAEVVAPGCDEIKRALRSLPLLTAGAAGFPAMLQSCRDHQEYHRNRDSQQPGALGTASFWDRYRPDLAASLRSLPMDIIPLLSGSADPHRAVEVHAVHQFFSLFLSSFQEPLTEAELVGRDITFVADPSEKTLPSSGLWSADCHQSPLFRHRRWANDQLESFIDIYSRKVELKSDALPSIHHAFTAVADRIAQSLPTRALLHSIANEAQPESGHISTFFCRDILRPLYILLHDHRGITDFTPKRVYIDLEDSEFNNLLGNKKDPHTRFEDLRSHVSFNYCRQLWGPSSALLSTRRDYFSWAKYRPPVYDSAELVPILEASNQLLQIFMSPDLDAQGPRKGSKAYKHMLEVGMLLMASGEAPEVAAAGLLHDLYELYALNKPEELPRLRREIQEKFGSSVDELIEAVTEPPKKPDTFFSRKTAIINKLESLDFPLGAKVARILCASKLSTLQDGIRYIYEKGTTKGWSEGTWAQNLALYSFYLSVFEKYQVSDSLLVNYRAQLVSLASWANAFKSQHDIRELRENVAEYFDCLHRSTNHLNGSH